MFLCEIGTEDIKSQELQEDDFCLVIKSKQLIRREIRITKTCEKEQGQEGAGRPSIQEMVGLVFNGFPSAASSHF